MVEPACIVGFCGLFMLAAPTDRVGAGPPKPALPTQEIDENGPFTLQGNTRPEANAANDMGQVANDFPMEHIMFLLRRSTGQEQLLEQVTHQLHERSSPVFHHWITVQEFGERFGLPTEEVATVAGRLESRGFTVKEKPW